MVVEIPEPSDHWTGGLSEGQLMALAAIAESGPDVYSIVKRAWSQGHDPDTIKQMLVSLQYPTGDVDRIVSELEKGKAAGGAQTSPLGSDKRQAAKPEKTIYVDRSGKASYDKPKAKQKTPARVETGNEYVDDMLNKALAAGGKERALKSAVMALNSYAAMSSRSPTDSRGRIRKYGQVDDHGILRSLRDIDTFLKRSRLGGK
jgi:hypothetical protein